jgi:hypothetical protein
VRLTMTQQLALVTGLILERPLCLSCLGTKAEMASAGTLETLLERIRHVWTVRREQGRCRACGYSTTVVSVARS